MPCYAMLRCNCAQPLIGPSDSLACLSVPYFDVNLGDSRSLTHSAIRQSQTQLQLQCMLLYRSTHWLLRMGAGLGCCSQMVL